MKIFFYKITVKKVLCTIDLLDMDIIDISSLKGTNKGTIIFYVSPKLTVRFFNIWPDVRCLVPLVRFDENNNCNNKSGKNTFYRVPYTY